MTEFKKGMMEMNELTVRNNIINTINALARRKGEEDDGRT